MIIFEPTKYNGGIYIWGDYWDLCSLHSSIHEITKYAPYNENITNIALGLAYDIRHAYQHDREEKEFGLDHFDKVTYRGTFILLPYLMFQVKLLRDFASYGTLTKLHQSHLYLLEHGIQETLIKINPEVAEQCSFWFESSFLISENYYHTYLDHVAKQYILGPQGKSRIKKLPKLLLELNPLSSEYENYASNLEKQAQEQNCSPYMLYDHSEWPDFKP